MTAAARGLPASVALGRLARLLPEPPSHGMWLGWLDLLNLELLVDVAVREPLDPLESWLLAAAAPPATLPSPDAMANNAGLVHRLRQRAVQRSWLEPMGDSWILTPAGAAALVSGQHRNTRQERRSFASLPSPTGGQIGYIPVPASTPIKLRPALVDLKDLRGRLERCLAENEDWKTRHGFPLEVAGIVAAAPEPWQAVPLGCTVEVCFLLAVGERWRLYAADPAYGRLMPSTPIMECASLDEFKEVFGEHLPQALLSSDWQRAWERGARSNRWPAGKAVRSPRFGQEVTLRIELDRLSTAPAEEQWLMAGHGPWHAVARLEFLPPSRNP